MQANLTSIPSTLRAVAAAQRSQTSIDVTTHLREAAEHLGRQTQHNHEHSMTFLRNNMANLASFATQMGGSMSRAIDKLTRDDPMELSVTPPPPPPPPPPSGARIKKAEKKALPPHKPGSSNAPPPSNDDDGYFTEAERDALRRKYAPTTKALVKDKLKKKDPPVGVKSTAVVEHDQKLTKHGPKPIIHAKNEEDKLIPHVPPASDMKYNEKKRKGAPPPPRTSIVRKRPMESGPPAKRTRRVSAHAI